MKALIGTERQVAWAEDIRARYAEVAEKLEEAAKLLRNPKEVTRESKDVLRGTVHTITYLSSGLTAEHEAAKYTARPFWLSDPIKLPVTSDHRAHMQAHAEWHEATAAAIRQAIEEEEDARYWINHR